MDAENTQQNNQSGPIKPLPNTGIWRFDAPPQSEAERADQLIAEYLLLDVGPDEPSPKP
jgi:hypothetical protein